MLLAALSLARAEACTTRPHVVARRLLAAGAPRVAWHHDVAAGHAVASAENKPVLLFFHADWDASSAELMTHTFEDPEVCALIADDFVAVEIDDTDEDDPRLPSLQRDFKLIGTPAIVVLAPSLGRELARFDRFVEAPELVTALRAAAGE
jgi:thioredoxin:protein disulfide reductase